MKQYRNRISAEMRSRLTTAGCPIEAPMTPSAAAVGGRIQLTQTGGVVESRLVEILPKCFACVLALRIATDLPRDLLIGGWDLRLPWSDPGFRWLEDPDEFELPRDEYMLGVRDLVFPRSAVLNHRRRYRRHELVDGLLLGICDADVPDRFVHGALVEGKLVALDEFAEPVTSVEISLWLDRSLRRDRQHANGGATRRRRSLFESKDARSRGRGDLNP